MTIKNTKEWRAENKKKSNPIGCALIIIVGIFLGIYWGKYLSCEECIACNDKGEAYFGTTIGLVKCPWCGGDGCVSDEDKQKFK